VRFVAVPLAGAWVVEIEPIEDARGLFARTWCREEFARRGLEASLAQCSVSYNRRRATLRGMHWQAKPHEEAKLVRCTRGAAYDAIVDLREGSGTRLRWFATELSAGNRRALYVPPGFAHGYLTLAEDTELLYQISVPHHPESARGFRWNDPAVGIVWPEAPAVIAARDRAYPDLEP
jgi:dTDP-4-dehydrorhamnose 3,5-epimerase